MANTGEANKGKMKLYSYWRSSCAHRVRIVLNLKGLEYEYIPVNLLRGEQRSQEFLKISPMGLVPALVDGDVVIADSFAIIMYLEDKYPERPLLPRDPQLRAINHQAAGIVYSGIQPLQNIGVLKYIAEKIHPDEKIVWLKDIIGKGFAALEQLLVNRSGKYATGDEIYLADVFIAPQVYGAITRFQIDMGPYPTLVKCNEAYKDIVVFQDCLPEKQPDAPLPSII